ncbi:hypothetical protein [Kitasatospora sp. GP82]|uniref:hypothetical protein n=1 Tax=Kitasatospora sp. GP82 TaxID=3035089 RepID=UPI002476AD9D|nr:hypothetical protein [Kitasatospora sp. GP82]MDH6125919.1 hypothetical protein [Kitasatospora sp. GP82]
MSAARNPPAYADLMLQAAELAGDARAADYWRQIKVLVDGFPPLTDGEKVTLRAIFSTTRVTASKAA